MKNFSAIRLAVRRPFQKTHGGGLHQPPPPPLARVRVDPNFCALPLGNAFCYSSCILHNHMLQQLTVKNRACSTCSHAEEYFLFSHSVTSEMEGLKDNQGIGPIDTFYETNSTKGKSFTQKLCMKCVFTFDRRQVQLPNNGRNHRDKTINSQ